LGGGVHAAGPAGKDTDERIVRHRRKHTLWLHPRYYTNDSDPHYSVRSKRRRSTTSPASSNHHRRTLLSGSGECLAALSITSPRHPPRSLQPRRLGVRHYQCRLQRARIGLVCWHLVLVVLYYFSKFQ
jgi:hypothetical protein